MKYNTKYEMCNFAQCSNSNNLHDHPLAYSTTHWFNRQSGCCHQNSLKYKKGETVLQGLYP